MPLLKASAKPDSPSKEVASFTALEKVVKASMTQA
jgi:hypothetical protein